MTLNFGFLLWLLPGFRAASLNRASLLENEYFAKFFFFVCQSVLYKVLGHLKMTI